MLPNEKNANAEKTVKGAVTFIKGAGTLYQLDSYDGFWIIRLGDVWGEIGDV